ncbi:rod shape-determining protein MreC [bacterium]|nr:rod shape-determining protein MreC [Bacteroides sp.]MBD5338009.1 rod shape-determining protein MreC [Bacteroides sp.]MBD5384964.1 rod shape-determining protein MreC [bacterium]
MRNLLNFILRYSTWFVFAFYVLLSCILLSRRDDYHASVLLSSANEVTSAVYRGATGVSGYFYLRDINRNLQESNAALENEILNLRSQLAEYKALVSDSSYVRQEQRFDYTLASVINNSTRHPRNYITINRGTNDGVRPGMGVVDQNGIVGIVNVAGPHTARVISIINETQHFSVKLKDTPYVGSLSWKGGDPGIAYMEEVPRHAQFHIGDTVVTSGFSTTFPYGINVGTVMNRVRMTDDNFYILKIRLASDFKTLSTVRVITDFYKAELDSLSTFDVGPTK